MKKFIISVLLCFTLSVTAAQITTNDTGAIIEQVERVGKWGASQFTVFGILCVVLGGSLYVNVRRSKTIKILNDKVEANLKDHKSDELGAIYSTLEKYQDLALTQKRDADKVISGITEIMLILKKEYNG